MQLSCRVERVLHYLPCNFLDCMLENLLLPQPVNSSFSIDLHSVVLDLDLDLCFLSISVQFFKAAARLCEHIFFFKCNSDAGSDSGGGCIGRMVVVTVVWLW